MLHPCCQCWQYLLLPMSAGDNKWGQLGNGNKKSSSTFVRVCLNEASVSAVQSGDQHSVLVTAKGKLYVWGRGDSGQLGLNDTRCKWRPTLVKDFRVVHPDKTLRRSKRSLPNMRPVPDNKRQRLIDAVHM